MTFSDEDVAAAIQDSCQSDWIKELNSTKSQTFRKRRYSARFSIDAMEFGARALGNRSIVADPRNSDTIHKFKVKMRIFGCPAPSILEERKRLYGEPKKYIR